MAPDDEDLIATYARNPEDLPPDDRARVEELIADDPAAEKTYEFYSGFFVKVENAEQEAIPRLEALLRDLAPLPRMIPLCPATPTFDPLHPPASEAESAESSDPIVLTSSLENAKANFAVRIYRTEGGYHIYATSGSNELPDNLQPTSHALLVLPETDVRLKLDAHGQGKLMGAGAEPADLFQTAELYPPQHYETIPSDALLNEPHNLLPNYQLRIDTPNHQRWLPSLHTDLTIIRYISLEMFTESSIEQLAKHQEIPNQHIVEKTGKEASISINHEPTYIQIAIYG